MPLQLIDISKFDPETNLEESKIIARNVLSACTDTGGFYESNGVFS